MARSPIQMHCVFREFRVESRTTTPSAPAPIQLHLHLAINMEINQPQNGKGHDPAAKRLLLLLVLGQRRLLKYLPITQNRN